MISNEGSQEYTSLLYIPSKAPFDLYDRERHQGVKLYVKRIFIMEASEKLMPQYLRFIKGVIDSNDLPITNKISDQVLTLPMYPNMTKEEKDFLIESIAEFFENSINAGSEGLMLKMLDKPYQAGSRGSHWLKLKREYRNELGDSLDLVVIGGFFGKGRRTGSYGTLLLATYDENTDTFPSICKVGTGFTDESLDQLYQILNPKITIKKNPRINSEMEPEIWFEPELVIEIVASEITLSPIHKAARDEIRKDTGLALRFPKFTGKIRVEKIAEDASTNEEVISLYKGQNKAAHDKNLM